MPGGWVRASWRAALAAALLSPALPALAAKKAAKKAAKPPLEHVQTIAIGGAPGLLDHLALDARHARLLLANTPNDSLDVVDLKAGRLARRIIGQEGVSGIAAAPESERIFLGNAGANACGIVEARRLAPIGEMAVEDPDDVRYDARTGLVYVGHGKTEAGEAGLTVFSARALMRDHQIATPAEPAAFVIENARARLYAAFPSLDAVGVVDTAARALVATYPMTSAGEPYALAIDESQRRLFVGCRRGAALVVLDSDAGRELGSLPIPGGVDDVSFDAKRERVYASCGEGFVAVVDVADAGHPELLESVATAPEARTSVFDPQSDRLYVAVPRRGGRGAVIEVFAVHD